MTATKRINELYKKSQKFQAEALRCRAEIEKLSAEIKESKLVKPKKKLRQARRAYKASYEILSAQASEALNKAQEKFETLYPEWMPEAMQ